MPIAVAPRRWRSVTCVEWSAVSEPAPIRARRRIMFVHAHPDDESISTGAAMARYAAAGDHVTLVTCTLGEEGEIHVPELAGLAADAADQLGGYPPGRPGRGAARARGCPTTWGGGAGGGPGRPGR